MVKKLGGGSFGTVYLVQRKKGKEMLAAKHQRAKKTNDMRYIRRELDILQMLSDGEIIVTLVDYFESSLQGVILTEYLAGGSFLREFPPRNIILQRGNARSF